MSYREQYLGPTIRFLLPSLKLKHAGRSAVTVEQEVHEFLSGSFGGYTATVGNVFGYWRDERGESSYGEHRQFTVSMPGGDDLSSLKNFLAELASQIGEECIYLEVSGVALLVYGSK